jgi:hypothetical protein
MFRFEASYAIHDGRTKYYQVFNIVNETSGEGVAVTHWGSYNPGASRQPRLHSKGLKIDVYHRHASASNASSRIRDKTKRGYENWDRVTNTFASIEEMDLYLNQWFKHADATLIMAHMTGHTDKSGLRGLSADFIVTDEIADMPTDEEIEALVTKEKEQKMQNKNWGTW